MSLHITQISLIIPDLGRLMLQERHFKMEDRQQISSPKLEEVLLNSTKLAHQVCLKLLKQALQLVTGRLPTKVLMSKLYHNSLSELKDLNGVYQDRLINLRGAFSKQSTLSHWEPMVKIQEIS